jgi:hypothetical protein
MQIGRAYKLCRLRFIRRYTHLKKTPMRAAYRLRQQEQKHWQCLVRPPVPERKQRFCCVCLDVHPRWSNLWSSHPAKTEPAVAGRFPSPPHTPTPTHPHTHINTTHTTHTHTRAHTHTHSHTHTHTHTHTHARTHTHTHTHTCSSKENYMMRE